MIGQEFIIVFKKDKAYLTPDVPLTFSQVSLPEFTHPFKSTAFWRIHVLSYTESDCKLICDVISYNVGESDFPPKQKVFFDKLKNLRSVYIRDINTNALFRTVSSDKPISIKASKESPVFRKEINRELSEPISSDSVKQTIKDEFFIPIKNVRFKRGGVSFDKKLKEFDQVVEFNIVNDDIREEFDAVKNYFSNVLKTKKIQVFASVELMDKKVTSKTARSPEIDKINKDLIENVRFDFVASTKKKSIDEIGKNIFTMEEYFDAFADENVNSNTFYSDDKQLFNDLLKNSNTKHYKHLLYLSSKHRYQIMKLRFVHKPFSFLFLLEGPGNYHLIWETLDTQEATYIWHLEKDVSVLKKNFKKIEGIINVIKIDGKSAYINSTEDHFRRIYHDYSESVDGFLKWKDELESILT